MWSCGLWLRLRKKLVRVDQASLLHSLGYVLLVYTDDYESDARVSWLLSFGLALKLYNAFF